MKIQLTRVLPTLLGNIYTGSTLDIQEQMAEKLVRDGYACYTAEPQDELQDESAGEPGPKLESEGEIEDDGGNAEKWEPVAEDSDSDSDGTDGDAG